MALEEKIDETLAAADAPAPDSGKKPDSPPRLSGASWKYAAKRSVREFLSDGGTDLAAMLTYFTVLSLAPSTLAVFSIISLVLANNADAVTVLAEDFTAAYIPADYQGLVLDLIDTVTVSTTGGILALIIGVATALWSASAYVKAFSRSANTIYERAEGRGIIKLTGTMLVTTLALLLGIVLILISLIINETVVTGLLGPVAGSLGLTGVLDFLMGTFLPVWTWVKWPVILALLIGLVAMLYYYTPNVRQPKFRWVSIGSIIAILGIILAAGLLYLYFAYVGGYSSYGTVGGVMALLFTLWVFNIVLLLGLEIDAEVERARQLQGDIAAEDNIQLPPRDTAQVEKQRKVRERLTSEGRELRAAHNRAGRHDDSDEVEGNRDPAAPDDDGGDASGSTAYRPE
ncbi:YihY/virulence factor BrkB family protein [Corynebacterium guangdongense]|uniref:Membrane protein n=1 Tax=Corynebacterium guangdongense TaxID=1783348 RepID=A0ABU1ZTZ9_9CORY|nr:YihY/virulence factor BrkB family protein [Corynebacterium guangdongense]MDR7328404.1 membrane protein [Corynebacterium guangdongense]WJZ16981.1 Ribonuclease BN-like family protein [Corynebacterium guangdongense]